MEKMLSSNHLEENAERNAPFYLFCSIYCLLPNLTMETLAIFAIVKHVLADQTGRARSDITARTDKTD